MLFRNSNVFEGSPYWITSVKLSLFFSSLLCLQLRVTNCVLHIVTVQTALKVLGSGERNGKLLAWLGTYELLSLLTLRKYPVYSKCNKYLK